MTIILHYHCIRLRVVVEEVVAVKGPYHRVTNWAEWVIVHVVTIILHYHCIRLRVVVVVVVAVKGRITGSQTGQSGLTLSSLPFQ